ncbi:MAG: acyl-CoA dehydrogenase [Propionibacteriaceae bacterium]|nr:acyl-CoA dehydrogenase [Propionibacteriaceae bacterium]
MSAFLLTEPEVGSDPARLATSMTPDDEGFVLFGIKLWATNGTIAGLFVVMARVPATEGNRGGITAFVVEADSPGITVEARNSFLGRRGIENALIRFDRVRVSAENVLMGVGRGLKIALATLNTGRLLLPAICGGKRGVQVVLERGPRLVG